MATSYFDILACSTSTTNIIVYPLAKSFHLLEYSTGNKEFIFQVDILYVFISAKIISILALRKLEKNSYFYVQLLYFNGVYQVKIRETRTYTLIVKRDFLWLCIPNAQNSFCAALRRCKSLIKHSSYL